MNENLGPFDRCDEPVRVKSGINVRRVKPDDELTLENVVIEGATIKGGDCGDQVSTFSNAEMERMANPNIRPIHPAPQEKQVDPVWDMYFTMGAKAMLADLSDGADMTNLVRSAGVLADLMVAEREKRRK